ncbi:MULTISPECIES: D-glycero-beta-D-manno-heptose 1,7-bisphosphate 7-phosphatase [unclassified Modicisalibacter]|uniref:D-glycero-beta-D-manno-heptose 1,7-bisphosphate 7-phosphatase n=1 Tax=unclassified Modicisalibacter TaxID=2679913 RepID=UPI001CCDB2A3|nr:MULTISPECIES: D-glycero-beta-D-manno-heptose 1,7-bisphosphate 7-phosphatase [unclassified Modicisalibacter]MBZ9558697.1 D-glycero-beta-D-manno-heptose 1,7-bisphosphate 7-phosphatase [Modicisalibacter sp. R2A 31.J]MBZ9575411.1 D-glycero-beta-D-manno-heptose 1,7-bisphosphate 7-phosphatase [Modicisalibacter sp. MOD 31.J]
MNPKLVILDRDGVINRDSDAYVKSLEEFQPYPRAIEAIARLCRHGWRVAVATNQSGIARGYFDRATLEAMHRRLNAIVQAAGGHIEHIAVCPHGPDDGCACRKPLPGLLTEIRHSLDLPSLAGSWMVGDSLRDIEAGRAAGCRVALVRSGKGTRTLEKHAEVLADVPVHDDLAAFVEALLNSDSPLAR